MIGAYRAFIRWIGGKRWVPAVIAPLLGRVDAALLRRGRQVTPFPTLLLTTTGAHSGAPHEAPLWYLEDDGYVVIATNYGRNEPDWSHNLRANPKCHVRIGKEAFEARAHGVSGTAWESTFDRFAEFYPPYRGYRERAGRDIPMWRLIRV